MRGLICLRAGNTPSPSAPHVALNHNKRAIAGKPDATTTGVLLEVLSLLNTYSSAPEVVSQGLRYLEEALNVAPQSSVLIRLEVGAEVHVLTAPHGPCMQACASSRWAMTMLNCCHVSNIHFAGRHQARAQAPQELPP